MLHLRRPRAAFVSPNLSPARELHRLAPGSQIVALGLSLPSEPLPSLFPFVSRESGLDMPLPGMSIWVPRWHCWPGKHQEAWPGLHPQLIS